MKLQQHWHKKHPILPVKRYHLLIRQLLKRQLEAEVNGLIFSVALIRDRHLGCLPLISLTWSELPHSLLWGLWGPHPITHYAQRWCCFPGETFILGTESNCGVITKGYWYLCDLATSVKVPKLQLEERKGRGTSDFNLPPLRSQSFTMQLLPSRPMYL